MSTEDPESYPPIGFFGPVRFLFRFLAMWVLLGVCLVLHIAYRVTGFASPWPSRFLYGIAWILNIRISTEGVPLREDVFYVANHLSWIDIPIIGGVTRSAFVAKAEIRKWPVTGWLATLNHTVFVSRGDRLGVGQQIEELKAAIAEHQPITIFPEGTTTDGTSLLPFKASLFAVLVPPPRGIRVQPILLDFNVLGPGSRLGRHRGSAPLYLARHVPARRDSGADGVSRPVRPRPLQRPQGDCANSARTDSQGALRFSWRQGCSIGARHESKR